LFTCAAIVALVTALLAWRRRRRTPAATALAVTMSGLTCWSAADGALYWHPSDGVLAAYPAVLLGSVGVVVVGIFVLRTVADPSWRLAPRWAALLAVEPTLLVAAAAVPATRELVLSVSVEGAGTEPLVSLGPLFAVHTAYSYVVIGAAYVHLLRRWMVTAAGVFRRQIGVLLAAALIPTVGNVVTVATQASGQGVDLTPLFFVVTGLINSWAVLRLGLLRLVPVAREQIVDTVPDGVLVVDPTELLIDLNPAATQLLRRLRPGLDDADVVGRLLTDVVGPRAITVLDRVERRDGHRIAEVAPGLWLDVRDTPVSDKRGRSLGRIIVVRDVSEQQARQGAVEALNHELAEQVRVIDQLRAVLAEEAVRDPLTGLHNRRHLDRVLAADLASRPRAGQLATVVVDIDHFKRINDRFGHSAGDVVLTRVARLLQAVVRGGDTAARLGGEEFVLVLPGAGRRQAVERAEQLRRDIAAERYVLDGEEVRITVSAGIAVCPGDGTSAAGLLEAADRALYTAKADGRDRIAVADAPALDILEGERWTRTPIVSG
jgi:diguanylate cyclase (GGDEF)-like protein